jgi:hypothetical protein
MAMLGLQDIRDNQHLINEIDWEMTPEKAVSLYLEWGNGWNHGVRMVKGPDDVSYYFVVYSWDEAPVIYLVRRDTQGSEELATIDLPPELAQRFQEHWGGHKGVYALTDELKDWLRRELGVDATWH